MTPWIEDPRLWISLAVFITAVIAVTRARRTNLKLRAHNATLRSDLSSALAEHRRMQDEGAARETQHANEIEDVRRDAESATKATVKSAVATLSTHAEELLVTLDNLQQKYGDTNEVLADLMKVDHLTNQFARRTKGISVLCGGWLGRREHPQTVFDVARSAQGRIRGVDRVTVHQQVSVSVISRAVEPVAMVLAELLDNATKYSAPGTPVEVNIQPVPTGVVLIVDDAGLGIDPETKARAMALLSAQEAVDINSLGEPPKFGFALCARLAADHGFFVSIDKVSPYGGVRAVLRVPEHLLTADVAEPAMPSDVTDVAAPPPAPTPMRGPSLVVGHTAGGLPKRRRVAAVARTVGEEAADTSEDSAQTAARIGAFARGTERGRASESAEGPQDQ
ncbi:sensor histidine kinase [Streptomyces misionensis]|uniref:sensor histidine kinase n=1 Tax=Streptomyces misionensis TaxID=67331 RepID=UPI00368DCC2E